MPPAYATSRHVLTCLAVLSLFSGAAAGVLHAAERMPMSQLDWAEQATVSALLNEGQVMDADLLGSQRNRQVLVYVVNEPDAEIFRRLQLWTAEVDDAEVQRAGRRLRQDLEKFPATVAQELADIRAGAPDATGVIIFTNEMARRGKALVKPIDATEFTAVDFAAPTPIAVDRRHHPLTDPSVLETALTLAAEQFDPAEHDFALIVKSHGTAEMAMATMFGHVMAAQSPTEMMELIEQFRRARAATGEGVQAATVGLTDANSDAHARDDTLETDARAELDKDNALGPDVSATLDREMAPGAGEGVSLDPMADNTLDPMADNTLDPMAENTLGGKLLLAGMPKDVFFLTLTGVVDRLQMRLPVVFLEACRSELGDARTARVVTSSLQGYVGVVYASDETGLLYSTVDYAKMLAAVGDGDGQFSLVDSLRNYLDDYRLRQDELRMGVSGQLPAE